MSAFLTASQVVLNSGPTWNSKALEGYFSPPLPRKFLELKFGPSGGFIGERTRNEADLGSLIGVGCDWYTGLAQTRLWAGHYTETRAQ